MKTTLGQELIKLQAPIITNELTVTDMHEATTEALRYATLVVRARSNHYCADGSYKNSDSRQAAWSCNVMRAEEIEQEPTKYTFEGYIATEFVDSFHEDTVAIITSSTTAEFGG